MRMWLIGWSVVLVVVVGCAEDEEKGCTPGTTEGCDEGFTCEEVVGEDPACFRPVELRGHVFDAATDEGVEGASVVCLDANGAARSGVAFTGEEGEFALRVAVPRTGPDGAPVAEQAVLRVAAQGYQWFAKPPRTALPVDLNAAAPVDDDGDGEDDDALVVAGPETEVALIALPGGGAGVRITGRVTTDDDDLAYDLDDDGGVGGVLVLAEQGDAAVSTAISGEDGTFVLFNVPPGATTVSGFRAGIVVTPATVTPDDDVEGVVLDAAEADLGSVSGKIELVNPEEGGDTSVILVVESTFDAAAVSGEAPAGLRAAPVRGDFVIENVPPGSYAVLAAFENDDLVRDPDETIGGTDIVYIDVPDDGSPVAIEKSFKVTGALVVESPGADGTEVVTDATVTFIWARDASAEGYEVRVYDVFGELVWEDTDIPKVTGSRPVTATWDAAGAVPGLVYQFRARSFHIENDGSRSYISATEDLKGVFRWLPGPTPAD